MSKLREEWVKAKDNAAKKGAADVVKKFTKGLGPKLDAVDKAVRANQKDASKAAAQAAIKITDIYRGMIRDAKTNNLGMTLVSGALKTINEDLGKLAMQPDSATFKKKILERK
jgi:hypothetical protein